MRNRSLGSALLFCLMAGPFGLGLMSRSAWAQSRNDFNDLVGKTSSIDPQTREFNDSWLRQCLEIQTLDRGELIEKLAARGVQVRDPKDEISMDLLQYVSKFLELIDYRKPEQIVLVPWKSEGAQRIRMETKGSERILQISTQAARDTFATQLRESLIARQNAGQATRGAQVDVAFNNSLFEQMVLAVATPEALEELIQKQFGVSTLPKVEDTRHMTLKELTFVLKQLVDLPSEVLDLARPSLTSIVRRRGTLGYKAAFRDYGESPRAFYDSTERSIHLTDGVFEQGQANSSFNQSGHYSGQDEILVHEMGHGVWAGLSPEIQKLFWAISWDRHGYFGFEMKASATEFLSEYSQRNILEDFAVHFAAYVQTPSKLQAIAPSKYRFFKEALFRGVEFQATAHQNNRVFCDACEPDINPPSLIGNLNDLLSIQTALVAGDKEKSHFKYSCSLKGVVDDVSGVSSASVQFEEENPAHDGYRTQWGHSLEFDAKTGQWTFEREIPRSEFFPGTYIVRYASLKDYAGNSREIKPSQPIRVDLMGTKTVDTTKIPDTLGIRPEEISLRKLTGAEREAYPIEGDILEITVPYPHTEVSHLHVGLNLPQTTYEVNVTGYDDYHPDYAKDINFDDPKMFYDVMVLGKLVRLRGLPLKWYANYQSKKEAFEGTYVSKPGDSKTVLRMLFGPQFKPQTVKISSVSAFVGSTQSASLVRQPLPLDMPSLTFSIRPPQGTKPPTVEILANEAKIESTRILKKMSGGDKDGQEVEITRLLITVPIQTYSLDLNRLNKDYSINLGQVDVKGPQGEIYSAMEAEGRQNFLASEFDAQGRAVMHLQVDLPRGHATGEFFLSVACATVRTNLTRYHRDPRTKKLKDRPGVMGVEAPDFQTVVRFADRDIKKKIEIR